VLVLTANVALTPKPAEKDKSMPSSIDEILEEEEFREEADTREDVDDLSTLSQNLLSQSVLSATDWTAETVLNQINKRNILLNPNFQRRDAWEKVRKSRFIESLILNLPVPQLVLAEAKNRKGEYIVIDGKQRLLSIRQFASKPDDKDFEQLKLAGLSIRKDLNGKTLDDLKSDPAFFSDLSAFENQSIRTVVIRNWPNESFLYQVFLRLNTGSVSLSPQELRQALHPGKFVEFVDTTSGDSQALREILKLKKPDFRMRDVELLVRFYAFKNFLQGYSGNLKEFLDYTCERLNNEWEKRNSEIIDQASEFEMAYQTAREIFQQKHVFRKWLGSKYEPRFNRAIFDVMMLYFSDPDIRVKAISNKEGVEQKFKELCVNDSKFLGAIERTTKSLEATQIRISTWARSLNEVLDLALPIPAIVSGRIR